MKTYRSCTSTSLFKTNADHTAGTVEEEKVLSPAGKLICLHSFASKSFRIGIQTGINQDNPVFLFFEKMDSGNTLILKIPLGNSGGQVIGLDSPVSSLDNFHIPGPGLISRDGMRARIEVPAPSAASRTNVGLVNLVYSL